MRDHWLFPVDCYAKILLLGIIVFVTSALVAIVL